MRDYKLEATQLRDVQGQVQVPSIFGQRQVLHSRHTQARKALPCAINRKEKREIRGREAVQIHNFQEQREHQYRQEEGSRCAHQLRYFCFEDPCCHQLQLLQQGILSIRQSIQVWHSCARQKWAIPASSPFWYLFAVGS